VTTGLVLASELGDRWRDSGPALWAIAIAAAAVWFVALAAIAFVTEPRHVDAGPTTLDPPDDEPPAVIGLITRDWELGHQVVPATLLDLAARHFVSIDWLGDRTLVRVRRDNEGDLTGYERAVLDHVRMLSRETSDGFVPADALTTGPEDRSKGWWRRFERDVHDDARARGLSRPRFGTGAKTILTALAVVVGLTVGAAASTLSDDNTNDDPLGAALAWGGISAGVLIAGTVRLGGERDTPAGRDAAARWLGLRSALADNPTFASQPPAAVSVWDRLIAYGAAMGVAQGAVAALPLGAESEREAWSPVGGRWRIVRVRYPDLIPPGYGRHPAKVFLVGAVFAAVGVFTVPAAISIANSFLDSFDGTTGDGSLPIGLRVSVGVFMAVVVAFGVGLAIVGALMVISGGGDLVRARDAVEGRVLRVRMRGDERRRYWHVAVDDGSSARVRAWRVATRPPCEQGATVRANVTPWLRYVRDLRVERVPSSDEPRPPVPSG
jgi:hypothetical protein